MAVFERSAHDQLGGWLLSFYRAVFSAQSLIVTHPARLPRHRIVPRHSCFAKMIKPLQTRPHLESATCVPWATSIDVPPEGGLAPPSIIGSSSSRQMHDGDMIGLDTPSGSG